MSSPKWRSFCLELNNVLMSFKWHLTYDKTNNFFPSANWISSNQVYLTEVVDFVIYLQFEVTNYT